MTNLESNLLEVLTRDAVRFCSRAVLLFRPFSRKCVRPSCGTFIDGFAKKALAGPYGSHDNNNNYKVGVGSTFVVLGPNQVQTFLNEHGGPGIHHIGLHTPNITEAVATLKDSGVAFIDPPAAYYSEVCHMSL